MGANSLSKIFLILFIATTTLLSAQTKLSGVILDASDDGKLEKALVVLLNPKDSILLKFTRTGENGMFTFPKIDTGSYKLIVSYPEYADYSQDLHVKDASFHLGEIHLSKTALLIEEVAIMGKIPIVIKGDTIEYNASSFKVDKDAKVDELLKVLPGITIDAEGKITAQGKEVKKVLLDGEEFFGNDPKLITKNIRADMVDKVQVYEKKSDLTDRTGVDDGERSQTIDIKLKEDSKKGMFGQALAGAGTDRYYTGKVMANKFKGSQKIAGYGIIANDGLVSLGFEDGEKYGVGGNSMQMLEGGGIMISSSENDGADSWSGQYNGNGVPKALNLGVSFSDKFANDKHKLNVNYRRSQMEVNNNNNETSQNNLPDVSRIDKNYTFSNQENRSNNANLRYDLKIDSLSDMTFKFGMSLANRDVNMNGNNSQRYLDNSIVNSNDWRDSANNITNNVTADILLTRRFKKLRRSLTFNANVSSNNNNSESNFYSMTNIVASNSILTVDQFKNNENDTKNLRTSLSYTEPLSKRLTATVGYNLSNNSSSLLNQSFDKNSATGAYDVLDEKVLNDFDFSNFNNGINGGLNYKSEKLTINLSNRVEFQNVRRVYNNLNHLLQRDQVSVFPQFSTNYQISKNRRIQFSYNGSSWQPALEQIEPLKQNVDQLTNYLDNPDLKAGFRNSYSLYFNSYKPLKDVSFYAGIWANQNNNIITSKVWLYKESGALDIQHVNINRSNWNINNWGGYRMPIVKKIALSMNIGYDIDYSNSYNYMSVVGDEPALNNSISLTFSPSIGFSSYQADKWSLYSNFRPGFRENKSTIQPEFDNTAFTFESYSNINYSLPKNIKLSLNLDQRYEAATKTLPAFNNVNLSGYISKKFLKDKSLEAQLMVNDLLNKNKGIRRYQNGYTFVQSSNDVLGRYAMIKLIYNFTTMKGAE